MGQRVLVVEDDPDIQRIVSTVLAKDYEVRSAEDGLAALMAIEGGFKPDLVIADVMMPRLDGMTFVKALKGHPTTATIPVIFLTAKSGPRDVIEGINVGARYYLTKPFKIDDLVTKVRRVLASAK
jgi:DNA-binding response OmpR family regulator